MKKFIKVLHLKIKILHGFFIFFLSLMLSLNIFVFPVGAVGVYDLPVVKAGESVWVIDQAQTLSLANESRLNTILKDLASSTGYEVRMTAIRRLDYGETIDNFTDKLFDQWFPTEETKENQLLLVLDTLTNNTALRVGNNLHGLLPEETIKSIVSETMGYPLREGKYNQALLDSSDRLVAILSGKPDPGPPTIREINVESTFTSAEDTDDKSATIWVVGFLIVATVIPMVTYYWYIR
jgi:uncharacterized protein